MRLGARVICEALAHLGAELLGEPDSSARYGRPIMVEGPETGDSAPNDSSLGDIGRVVLVDVRSADVPVGSVSIVRSCDLGVYVGLDTSMGSVPLSTPAIVCSDSISPARVLNCLQALFDRLDAWDVAVSTIAMTTADVCDMVRATLPVLRMRTSVYDRHLNILADTYVNDDSLPESWLVQSAGCVDPDTFNQSHSGYDFSVRHEGPTLNEYPQFEGEPRAYVNNLYTDGVFEGSVCITFGERDMSPGEWELAGRFCELVHEALRRQYRPEGVDNVSVHAVLFDLLDRKRLNERSLGWLCRACKSRRLELADSCAWCFVVIRPCGDYNDISLEYVCSYMEAQYRGCVSVPYENDVAVLWPLAMGEGPEDVCSRLAEFLDQKSFQAGVSFDYEDVARTWVYYREACHALWLRSRRALGAGGSLFGDCALEFVVGNMVGDFEVTDLMPRGLFRLLQHDAESPVNYWQTLSRYLSNNLNATKTARELYVHRSTFLQRMEAIEGLLGMSLDDSRSRDYVRFCMHAYDLLCGRGRNSVDGGPYTS